MRDILNLYTVKADNIIVAHITAKDAFLAIDMYKAWDGIHEYLSVSLQTRDYPDFLCRIYE